MDLLYKKNIMNIKTILGLTVASVAGFLTISTIKGKTPGATPETTPETTPGTTPNTTSKWTNDVFPLKINSIGNNVTKFQNAAKDYFKLQNISFTIGVDGKFGGQSESAALRIFGLNNVTQNMLNWLITTNEAIRFGRGLSSQTNTNWNGRKVSLKLDKNILLYPAYSIKPTTSQSIQLSNGLHLVNSGLTKKFAKGTTFTIAYNGNTSVIADFGTIVKPDSALNQGAFNSSNVSSRYFMIEKKDLNLI